MCLLTLKIGNQVAVLVPKSLVGIILQSTVRLQQKKRNFYFGYFKALAELKTIFNNLHGY